MFGMFTLLTKPFCCGVCLLMCYRLFLSLDVTRVCPGTISEEHKELQRLHSCKNEEHEGVVLNLQSQIRNAHDELDQIQSTLGTLKGADRHGLINVYNLKCNLIKSLHEQIKLRNCL